MAYSVSRRTRVVLEVLFSGAKVVALGLLVGVVGALAGARVLRSLLYGVEPNDPAVLAMVCVAVGLIALAATLFPALRASRVDPVSALSSE